MALPTNERCKVCNTKMVITSNDYKVMIQCPKCGCFRFGEKQHKVLKTNRTDKMKIREGYCPKCHAECMLYDVETSKGRMWLCFVCAVNLGYHKQFQGWSSGVTFDELVSALSVFANPSAEAAKDEEKYSLDIDDGAVRDE